MKKSVLDLKKHKQMKNQIQFHSNVMSFLSSFSSTIFSLLPEPLDVLLCNLLILEYMSMNCNFFKISIYLKWRQQQSITPHSGSRQSQLQETIWEKEMGLQGKQEDILNPSGWQQEDDVFEYLKNCDCNLIQSPDILG